MISAQETEVELAASSPEIETTELKIKKAHGIPSTK